MSSLAETLVVRVGARTRGRRNPSIIAPESESNPGEWQGSQIYLPLSRTTLGDISIILHLVYVPMCITKCYEHKRLVTRNSESNPGPAKKPPR